MLEHSDIEEGSYGKILFELDRTAIVVESVLMKYTSWQFSLHFITGRMPDGMHVSVPRRLGGKGTRDLRLHQRCWDQVYQNSEDQRRAGISNIVVMGSGEPLDNYDNLLKFIDTGQ